MKDKRGFLLGEETLKIIIAVICIVFLIFLLASVYYNMTGQQKTKEAGASMDLISNETKRINAGGAYNEEGILIPNPSGWFIFGFAGEKKPNLCAGENCACICRRILINIFDRQVKECDSKGACFSVSNLNEFEKIKIEKSGVWVLINKEGGQVDIAKK